MSRHSRYPLQTTAHAQQRGQLPSHQRLRNPWVAQDNRESKSTSSSSSRTHRGRTTAPWMGVDPGGPYLTHYGGLEVSTGPLPHHPLLTREFPTIVLQPAVPPHVAGSAASGSGIPPAQSHVTGISGSSSGSGPVRISRGSGTPGAVDSSGGGVDGCGGHCVAFENFCYYCLQVMFIAGIFTGLSLTIAGSVLHSQRGVLLVLVYIGAMVALVSVLLLTVQCCVRRNVKRRQRAVRNRGVAPGIATLDAVPLQDLTSSGIDRGQTSYQALRLESNEFPRQGPSQTFRLGAADLMVPGLGVEGSRSGRLWWCEREPRDEMMETALN